jgi:hypothetical protein
MELRAAFCIRGAFFLIPLQRPCLRRFAGAGIERRDLARQRDRVFHRQLGPGADGPVRGVGRVPQQYQAPVVPAPVAHAQEALPRRRAPVSRVMQQLLTAQDAGKHLLGRAHGRVGIHAVEAGAAPGAFVALHDERCQLLVEAVRVGLIHPPVIAREGKGERVEAVPRPEPHEAVGADIEVRLEAIGVAAAERRVDAVRGDDQVSIAESHALEIVEAAHGRAEAQVGA